MDDLTITQRDALVKLVKFQDQVDGELVFALKPTDQGYNDELLDVDVYALGQEGVETIVTVPHEYVQLWADLGYASTGQRIEKSGVAFKTFILRRKAFGVRVD